MHNVIECFTVWFPVIQPSSQENATECHTCRYSALAQTACPIEVVSVRQWMIPICAQAGTFSVWHRHLYSLAQHKTSSNTLFMLTICVFNPNMYIQHHHALMIKRTHGKIQLILCIYSLPWTECLHYQVCPVPAVSETFAQLQPVSEQDYLSFCCHIP